MSMFSIPEQLLNDVEKMKQDMSTRLPKEMASAANLMAHPAAGAMALSALGFGLAGQAAGLWFGAMAAGVETAQKLMAPLADELQRRQPVSAFTEQQAERAVRDRGETVDTRTPAAKKARKAVDAVMSDARDAARAAMEAVVATRRTSDVADEAIRPAGAQAQGLRKPVSLDRPEHPDDLKVISGIGPKLETVLNGLGVWTFAQIGAWGPAEIAWVDDTLGFKGRIERDGWVGQAVKLDTGKSQP